jgi:hypothetical protein
LKEAATVLKPAGFGLVCGSQTGPDSRDGYDARDWKEGDRREVLVPKIEAWLAFSNLVHNINTNVPGPDGTPRRWTFDCFGHVILARVYAHWRTLTRGEFNARYTPLQLGINSSVNREWEKPMVAMRPGDKPFVFGEVKPGPGGVFKEERIPVGRSWNELIDSAPVGSQITWGNIDAQEKCRANPDASFCPYMFENTYKVGPNEYSAHPFGVRSRQYIENALARAVLGEGASEEAVRAYIARYVFISGIRIPKRPAAGGTTA